MVAGQLRQRGAEAAGELLGALVRVEATACAAPRDDDAAAQDAQPFQVEAVTADGGRVAADEQLDVGRTASRPGRGAGGAAAADADRGGDGVEGGDRVLLGVEVQVEGLAVVAGQQLPERRLVNDDGADGGGDGRGELEGDEGAEAGAEDRDRA